MLRWILIGAAVLVVAVMGTCYWGYRQVIADGNTATVTVATTPTRAWTYLTDVDSLATIIDSTMTLTTTGARALAVGDTLRLRERSGSNRPASSMTWRVTGLDSARVRQLSTGIDTAQKASLQRIDSVLTVGDSVRISSTVLAQGMERIAASDSVGKVGGMVMTGATRLMIGGMRLMAQHELDRLKLRLERP